VVGNVVVGAREESLAGNEALFREVNERVAEVATQFRRYPTYFVVAKREQDAEEVAGDRPTRLVSSDHRLIG
jgi:hypothetical protein